MEAKTTDDNKFNVGCPCFALSLSPCGRFIVVGGREVKVLSQEAPKSPSTTSNNGEQSKFSVLTTVRAGNKTRRVTTTDLTKDVRWNQINAVKICTVPTNGKITIWNLENETTKCDSIFSEHDRTVNRVSWHPQDPSVLLSGSQDGMVKLWDTRAKASKATFNEREAVRDVAWHPTKTNVFAAAYESGMVQIWDASNNRSPLHTINAHQGLALCVDWHPTLPDVLASGGRDRMVNVWDISNGTTNRTAPKHVIRTISSVGRIQWRPGHTDHIATAADQRGKLISGI